MLPQPVPPVLHEPIDFRMVAAFARFAQADRFARELIPSKAAVSTAGRAIPEYAALRGPDAPRDSLWTAEPTPVTALDPVPSPLSGAPLALSHYAMPGAGLDSPVILLLDGEVWREQFPVAAALENRAGVSPAHLLFLDSGGPMQRQLDYPGSASETGALLAAARAASSGVVPDIPWIVAGQSLGGLFAALAATRHPQWVRAGVAQSASLWWPSAPSPWVAKGEGWFEERAALADSPILIEAGTIDAGVVEFARPAAALLRAQDALIDYREHPGGHDVLWWQAALPAALTDALNS